VTTFYHTFGFFQHNAGYLYVTVGGFVEGGSDDLGVDAASHVSDFLGTFVDQQDDHVHFGVVGSNGVGDILEQDGFTRLGLGYD